MTREPNYKGLSLNLNERRSGIHPGREQCDLKCGSQLLMV